MVYRLVADVGGTNARLALSQGGALISDTPKSYVNADWQSLYEIIKDYLAKLNEAGSEFSRDQMTEMVIGLAGPVQADHALLTNHNWRIEVNVLKREFKCEKVGLINDLSALGYALPSLKSDGLTTINQGALSNQTIEQSLVVGIGTGCNVSPVVKKEASVFCAIAEAGHVAMPLKIANRLEEIGLDKNNYPSVEHLFSGRGFTAFCQEKANDVTLDGRAVVAAYGLAGSEHLTGAVNDYAELLGHLLREFYLSYMPASGIYFAGSVARAVMQKAPQKCVDVFLQPSPFYKSEDVPIHIIEEDSAAFIGCAHYFKLLNVTQGFK